MGRRPKQTFLQRRRTDDQEAHEKMLSITNCQGNASQNYNEISPHPIRMTVIKKIHKQQMLARVWREGSPPTLGEKPSDTVGGNVNCGEQYGGSLKN